MCVYTFAEAMGVRIVNRNTFIEVESFDLARRSRARSVPARIAADEPLGVEATEFLCGARSTVSPSLLCDASSDTEPRSAEHARAFPTASVDELAATVSKYICADVNNGVSVKWSGINPRCSAEDAMDLLARLGISSFDYFYLPPTCFGGSSMIRCRAKGFAHINFFSQAAATDAVEKLTAYSEAQGKKKFSFEYTQTCGVSAHLKQFKRWKSGVVYVRISGGVRNMPLGSLRIVAGELGWNRLGEPLDQCV